MNAYPHCSGQTQQVNQYEMAVFRNFFLAMLIGIISAQSPCDPLDDGPIPPVPPTLYLSISEATHQDLMSQPNSAKYQDEIKLHGSVHPSSPNAIALEPMDDFSFLNPADYFVFETDSRSRNIMKLIKPLDRDGPTADITDDTNVVTFTLQCAPLDNLTDTTFYSVSLMIVDVNDNPPTFLETPNITNIISENSPRWMKVATVQAEDKDLNLDGGIQYSIVQHNENINDGSEVFSIDKVTGDIRVSGIIDYESLGSGTNYYTLVITATDSGPVFNLTTQTTLQIRVYDVDELGPTFQYDGCIRVDGYCIWPTYTTFTGQELDTPLIFYPVPNIMGKSVEIMAKDRDFDSRPIMEFSIITTVPVGYNDYFDLRATRYVNDARVLEIKQTREIPKNRMSGFEIFLKVEEAGREDLPGYAMILFVDNNIDTITQSPGSGTGQTEKQDGSNESNEEYSQTTVALIVIVAVTLTLVVCLAIVVLCLVFRNRKQSGEKHKLVMEGHTNHGAVLTPL